MTSTTTKAVRLSVPVTPEVQATFQRLAEASGRSMAASLSQWLVDTQQAAEMMAENFERLRAAPGDVVTRVKLYTASLEDFAEEAIQNAMDRAERAEFDAPGGVPLAGKSGRGVRRPPSGNTGGKGLNLGGGKSGSKGDPRISK